MNNTSTNNSNKQVNEDTQRTLLQQTTQLNTTVIPTITTNELLPLEPSTDTPEPTPPTTIIQKKSSKKCPFGDCSDKPVRIVGECRYCTLKYCSRHRLPEAHLCDNLVSCRLDASNRLSTKLLGEKCVASKV